jgi:hypothetical protein
VAAPASAAAPVLARPTPTIDRLLGALPVTPTTLPPASGSPASGPAPTAPPSPAVSGPAAPAPVTPYTAHGQLVAPDLLGRLGLGLTVLGGPGGGCGPSATQGLDAWVFDLPSGAPGAGSPVKVAGSDLLGLHNLAVSFVSAGCRIVGQLDTPAADEAGVLPAGTRYVIVSDRTGFGTSIALTVG